MNRPEFEQIPSCAFLARSHRPRNILPSLSLSEMADVSIDRYPTSTGRITMLQTNTKSIDKDLPHHELPELPETD